MLASDPSALLDSIVIISCNIYSEAKAVGLEAWATSSMLRGTTTARLKAGRQGKGMGRPGIPRAGEGLKSQKSYRFSYFSY